MTDYPDDVMRAAREVVSSEAFVTAAIYGHSAVGPHTVDAAARAIMAERLKHRAIIALALRVAESWIHDHLDGTGDLQGALAELEPARAALREMSGQKEGDA
ncbi:hypothetical protein [Stappia indica]|uniref:hypothetical protein n=1 Tax=Stappia indica TaxID=538381 RepID=UPI001CD30E8C|nr:hypothetical protein [Stappia indica]MCA1297995.1 hypothetical protein [Stappia indica]